MSGDMEKISGRVPEGVKEQLDDESVNASGLIRSLLEAYLLAGDAVEVGLERRLKDKESELDRKRLEKTKIENDIASLEREIDDLQDKIKERRQSVPEEVVEFAEKIKAGSFRPDQLEVDNPAVQNWSNKAGIPPETFVEEVNQRL